MTPRKTLLNDFATYDQIHRIVLGESKFQKFLRFLKIAALVGVVVALLACTGYHDQIALSNGWIH